VSRTIAIGMLFCYCLSADGQNVEFQNSLQQNLELLAEISENEIDDDVSVADLEFLLKHPLDLNKSDYEMLLSSGLFKPAQALNIVAHKKKYGWLYAVEELQVVEGFSRGFIRFLKPYVTISDPSDVFRKSIFDMLSEGDHYLIMRTKRVIEKSKGLSSAVNRAYPGWASSVYGKYNFRFGNKLSAGFTLENDAGEVMFAKNRIVDFFSWHIFIRSGGIFRKIAVGDYSLRYGQGLTLSTGQRSGLPFSVTELRKINPGISPYRSVSEFNFFRGGAVSMQKGMLRLDMFASSKKIDANIKTDTSGVDDIYFTSLLQSGLHRNDNELSDRKAVRMNMYGLHSSINLKNLKLGFTGYRVAYSRPLISDLKPYNTYYFRGSAYSKAGVDFSFSHQNIQIFGELSTSGKGKNAAVIGSTLQLHTRLTWSVLVRSFSPGFNTFSTGVVAAGSSARNETGILTGLYYQPSRFFRIHGFIDRYKRRWLAFSSDRPSGGTRAMATFSWKPKRSTELRFRYRINVSEENKAQANRGLKIKTTVKKNYYRLHYSVTLNKVLTFRTRSEWSVIVLENGKEKGHMIYQDVIYKPMMKKYSFSFRYILFGTDGYNSRIYAYENDVLYSYSIPAYYNTAYRYYLLVRYKISGSVDFWVRYSSTRYSDIESIGSGNDEIKGNSKSDIKIQVRVKF
jgi:hypothetical protein